MVFMFFYHGQKPWQNLLEFSRAYQAAQEECRDHGELIIVISSNVIQTSCLLIGIKEKTLAHECSALFYT